MATPTLPASSAANAEPDDWLGYSAYADALWARVVRALDKDKSGKPLGDDPLVIGIFGEWGAGKSHLLKLVKVRAEDALKQQIAARESDPGFSLTVPVWFQPWKYEHEEHLHVPMVIHVLNALKDALKRDPTVVQALVETGGKAVAVVDRVVPVLAKGAKVAKSIFPIAQKILKSISFFGVSIDLPDDLEDWLEAAADAGGTKEKDKTAADVKKSATDHAPKHVADGSYFYRIHELLDALTRPDTCKERKSLFGHADLTPNTRINFVIFIDDLDRCLPEKAVQTLELIKTVFNTESFAFVLALDDEVIERGIGHRYKDYQLVGKKPEMPITGFEYLEKIIHLPFRLPALTREQAGSFVRRYESDIEPDAALRWFDEPAQPEPVMGYRLGEPGQPHPGRQVLTEHRPSDLLELALSGFDAFMPRKLIRLVELLHQVAAIARLRQKPLQLSSAGEVDVRVVLVLLLIQLFQPELFRVIRRRGDSFPTLLAAFAVRPVLGVSTAPEPPDLPSAQMADIDLWRWAVNPKDAALEWEPKPLEPLHGHAAHCIAQAFKGKPDERTSRTSAQQVRLPIVLQLIEHRAAQRHVFDVLKLIKRLADEMSRTRSSPHELNFEPYRSLLAQPTVVPEVSGAGVTLSGAAPMEDVGARGTFVVGQASPELPSLPTFSLSNVEELAQLLVSPETEAQANMVSRMELRAGHVLDERSVANLVCALNTKLTQGTAEDWQANKVRTLNGLQYLAPFLSPEHARAMWQLVADCVDINKPTDPKLRALWGDVRYTLGCDDRFDPLNFCLHKDRYEGHGVADEPITGFVKVPAGEFIIGSNEDASDNPPLPHNIETPFYISRTLVTVNQYAEFIRDGGYADGAGWWDKQGDDWRNGLLDSKVRDEIYQTHLHGRGAMLRNKPMLWDEQKTPGTYPVWGVSWFEARAYARWLNSKLAPKLSSAVGVEYAVMLPTELQWERSARATSLIQADSRNSPWGNEEFNAEKHANLHQAIGSVCTVGLFPPNPVGLQDMAGNTWEWMDNLYTEKPETFQRVDRNHPLASANSLEKSDQPSLRGGSWIDRVGSARCSYRGRDHPGYWDLNIGFRVVLSLPD